MKTNKHCEFDVELSPEELEAFQWLRDTLARMVANGSKNAGKAKLCAEIIEEILRLGAKAHEEIHDRDVAGAFLHLLKKIGLDGVEIAVTRLAEAAKAEKDVN